MEGLQFKIKLSSGAVLRRSDRIRLADKIRNNYKKTKQFDPFIKEPIDLLKYDDFDFKYVSILSNSEENTSVIHVHKLLSLFEDDLLYFKIEKGVLFGYTQYLKIELEKALLFNEIELLENLGIEKSNQKWEFILIEEIQEMIGNLEMGLITEEEKERLLRDKNIFYYEITQKKWATNYYRSLRGDWCRKNKKE